MKKKYERFACTKIDLTNNSLFTASNCQATVTLTIETTTCVSETDHQVIYNYTLNVGEYVDDC